jgi:hypothetical protein
MPKRKATRKRTTMISIRPSPPTQPPAKKKQKHADAAEDTLSGMKANARARQKDIHLVPNPL